MVRKQNKHNVKFGQLSPEDIEFLKARMVVKLCPKCNQKADFTIVDENVVIDNVCCEKFARIIGDSLSVKNINKYAINFRGEIINTFCLLEVYVDTIITLTSAQFPDNFMGFDIPKVIVDLSMRDRKALFKICLKKYEELTAKNSGKIWGHFNNIVDKRNHLAHWPVDTSKTGLELLLKTNRIKFVNINGAQEEETFNSKTTFLLVQKIEKLTVDIIEVFKFFRDNESKRKNNL